MKKVLILIAFFLCVSVVFAFTFHDIVRVITGSFYAISQPLSPSEYTYSEEPQPLGINCYTDSDCGTDRYLGSYHCKNNDVYDWLVNFKCINPGTNQSYCVNTTTEVLMDDCQENEYCVPGEPQCQKNETCTVGWKCFNVSYKGYQKVDCKWTNITLCEYGCENGNCLTTNQTNNTCSDTDGGRVYTVKGTVSGLLNGVQYSKTDLCVSDTRLSEYYCDGHVAKVEEVDCVSVFPNEMVCKDGACTNVTYTCKDTDGGINIFKMGIVTLYKNGEKVEEHTDYCAGKRNVTEYWCKENRVKVNTFVCPEDCYSGQCVNKSFVPIPIPPTKWYQPLSDFFGGVAKSIGSFFGVS